MYAFNSDVKLCISKMINRMLIYRNVPIVRVYDTMIAVTSVPVAWHCYVKCMQNPNNSNSTFCLEDGEY